MLVKAVEVAVLVEDSANPANPDLLAKHGLSFFLNVKMSDGERSLLLDTGPSPNILLHNVNLIGVELQKTEAVILSHGHYDHTGGLIEALKPMEQGILVVAHPKVFDIKLKMYPRLKFVGSSFNLSDIKAAGGIPLLVTGPMKITEGILTTGEIERVEPFEGVEGFGTIDNGRFIEDVMLDDQSLIINIASKGLVIIAGCAHAGIVNTIKYAQRITGRNRIHAVLGGFHLAKADNKRIRATVDELRKLDLNFIMPCHCTGSKAVTYLKKTFGDQCQRLHTGDIIKL